MPAVQPDDLANIGEDGLARVLAQVVQRPPRQHDRHPHDEERCARPDGKAGSPLQYQPDEGDHGEDDSGRPRNETYQRENATEGPVSMICMAA